MLFNKPKRKILFVSSYPLEKCGISTYSKKLLQNISENSYDISVFTIRFISSPITYFYKSFFLLYKLISDRFDIVHFQYTPTILGPLAPLFYLAAKLRGVKIVTTVHENPQVYIKYFPSIFRPLFIFFNEKLLHMSDSIVVFSSRQQEELISFIPEKKSNIHIIPQGVNNIVITSNEEMTDRYSHFLNYNMIGFFGFLRQGKGIEILLDAYKNLNNTKNTCLLIAGKVIDQKYYDMLKNKVSMLGLRNVFFLDYLQEDEMHYLMSKCCCVVLPYTKNTNSSILMDAISAEVPVIGSDIGSIGEYINQFSIGKAFSVGSSDELLQSIHSFLNNKKEILQFKNNIRLVKNNYSWAKISEYHRGVYDTVSHNT